MTAQQVLAFAIVGVMMVLFIWGRLRYDVVAMLALLASLLAGTVTPDHAFTGFSDDIVIIVGSALVVSAAVSRSGLIEAILRWLVRRPDQAPGALVLAELGGVDLPAGDRHAFAVGESALATGVRRHLVRERGWDRSEVTFCGYWKR